MSNKFTILLLGPAGSGKSTFISGLSGIDIFEYIAAKTFGGANTTKILTTYEFERNFTSFSVAECISTEPEDQEKMQAELQKLSNEEDGMKKVFEKINSEEFAKKCLSVTLRLPCKEGIISQGSKFDTIVVRDSRGFGDISDNGKIEIDKIGVTDDVNTILFFSISAIQQPAIFGHLIDGIMKVNLKTPMLLLRRDGDLTQNDEDFKSKILNNLSTNDYDLKDAAEEIGKTEKVFRLNTLVFEVPEVKKWKGTLNVEDSAHVKQLERYGDSVKEVIEYAIGMYDKLYEIIVDKMQGEYQDRFVINILNNLLSDTAFNAVTNVVKGPCSKPGKDYSIERDTNALACPVKLYNLSLREDKPFANEVNKRGNRYGDGIIPSYSYSCVNFRAVFCNIVDALILDNNLCNVRPLLHTFMNIVLKEYTVTVNTGYCFKDCSQNAFKFYMLTGARDKATQILKNENLIKNDNIWKCFEYISQNNKYEGSNAIAVLIYKCLIDSLNLHTQFDKWKSSEIKEESTRFVEDNKKDDIVKQMDRKKKL